VAGVVRRLRFLGLDLVVGETERGAQVADHRLALLGTE
jgi:hypothetical protein